MKNINTNKMKSNSEILKSAQSVIQTTLQQCPYIGGNAVYTARNFVALFTDTIIYNDALSCLQNGIYKEGNNQALIANDADVLLIPNPADDKIEIVIKNKEEGICQIEILNFLGEILLKDKTNCLDKRKTISTKILAPGVYVIKVKPKNSSIKVAKLIIQR